MTEWMACLGCYAEAEPDEVAAGPECPRPCACDNGYTVEPGAGILDSRHVWEWVPGRRFTVCDSCSATAVYHLLAEDDEGYVCAKHFDEYEVHVRFDSYARVSS